MHNFSEKTKRMVKIFNNESALDYYILFNRSSDLPYHNDVHVDFMIQDLADIYKFGQDSLNFSDIHDLIDAIIFHDFNHSGGKLDDSENIKMAVEAWKAFYGQDTVTGIIRATQFPYVNNKELTFAQKVIRDLDMMTIFHANYPDDDDDYNTQWDKTKAQMNGLYLEMKTTNPAMRYVDYATIQKEFHLNAEYHTKYGQYLKQTRLEKALKLTGF